MAVVLDASLLVAYDPLRDGSAVVSLARRLERQNAYAAAYLALARELDGACWTLDGRLVRNATPLGLPVHLAAS
jgi:predicted nucleic acid-binding protein